MNWVDILKLKQIVTPTTRISQRKEPVEEPERNCCEEIWKEWLGWQLKFGFFSFKFYDPTKEGVNVDEECKNIIGEMAYKLQLESWFADHPEENKRRDPVPKNVDKRVEDITALLNDWMRCENKSSWKELLNSLGWTHSEWLDFRPHKLNNYYPYTHIARKEPDYIWR